MSITKPLNPQAQEYRPTPVIFSEAAPLPPPCTAVQVVAITASSPSPKLIQLPHQLLPAPVHQVVGFTVPAQTHQKVQQIIRPFIYDSINNHYYILYSNSSSSVNHIHHYSSLPPISFSDEKKIKMLKSPKCPPPSLKKNDSGRPGRIYVLPPRQDVVKEKPRRRLRKWKPVGRSSTADAVAKADSAAAVPPPTAASNGTMTSYTTVMIRNIPNQLRRDFMLEFLDDYCKKYSSEYDFMYLPMDFRKRNNLGYAFVNFTTARAARKFSKVLEGFRWGIVRTDRGTFTSKKICEITPATIQGRADLIKRFQDSTFTCDRLEYLPVLFCPPRNGLNFNLSPPIVIGTMQPSLRRR